jgi:hypothetical protein
MVLRAVLASPAIPESVKSPHLAIKKSVNILETLKSNQLSEALLVQ